MPGSLGIRQEISKAFKLHGYSLKVEASRHLEQLLTPIQDRSKWIEAILDTLGKKDLQSANLDKQILEKIIKVLAQVFKCPHSKAIYTYFYRYSYIVASFRNCKNRGIARFFDNLGHQKDSSQLSLSGFFFFDLFVPQHRSH